MNGDNTTSQHKSKKDLVDLCTLTTLPDNASVNKQMQLSAENSCIFTCDKLDQKNSNFIISLFKNYEISICKPLIPLKLAQFCWFGAGSFVVAFITVHLKQRGVTLSQLSWMNIIGPVVQILGTTATGIIADKIGRSKPVLVANLLLVVAMLLGIIFMPSMNNFSCLTHSMNFTCPLLYFDKQIIQNNSDIIFKECSINCSTNDTKYCDESILVCDENMMDINTKAFAPSENISSTKLKNDYNFNFKSQLLKSLTDTRCSNPGNKTCRIVCLVQGSHCMSDDFTKDLTLIGYILFYVLFLTTFSNVYRCFDVTAMALVKKYNSSFGKERFFAIVGNLIVSPLAGLLVEATTEKGEEENYSASFYLFISMVLLVLLFIYKLPVKIEPPGKNMMKNTFFLLKNPDVLSLILVVLVLGTAWNFTKVFIFWYLEELNAPSVLIGLIPSVSALYGLPFLLSSNWWIRKFGSTNLIIIAFIAYALKTIGYSVILNPWYSLVLDGLGGLTYFLLWVAVVELSHELAPEGMRATTVSVAGAIHYSIGKATGGLITGLVMDSYGGKMAFRLIAMICLISAILYSLYLRIKHNSNAKKFKLGAESLRSYSEKVPQCIFVLSEKSSK